MRDQKPRLRKFACSAAIAAMLALSGRAAERVLDDLMLVRLPAPPEGRRASLRGDGRQLPEAKRRLSVVERQGRPAMT